MRDQRFDGYQPEQLAQVVEKFRDGPGPAGITTAVDALKSISAALAGTEEALRTQLKALGVDWESHAAGQASAVVAREAGFSGAATAKVEQAARMMFEQAEAFTRTRNKLPAPEDLRKAGGYTFGDSVFSIFGFETDHAADVRAAEEAKAQAVDALNAYAHDSGNYVGSASTVDAPEPISLVSAPGAGLSPVTGASPVPGTSVTQAQGTQDVPPVPPPGGGPAGVTGPAGATGPAPFAGEPARPGGGTAGTATAGAGEPGPGATGFAGREPGGPGSAAAPVRPSGAGGGPAAAGGAAGRTGSTAGAAGPGLRGAPGWEAQLGPAPQIAAGPGPVRGPGEPAEGRPATGGGARAGLGAGEGVPRGPAAGELARGRAAGALPPVTTTPTAVGPGFAAVRAPGGPGALAEATPALGAAGASGALTGEDDRPGRAGRATAGHRIHQVPMGDLPEEEEARLARRGGHTPDPAATRAILEPAAPPDGAVDGEDAGSAVRRFGVDDTDLFADRRDVAPDTIGDR
nr:PPE domain-containing protein [Amycolatopsis granulosa]